MNDRRRIAAEVFAPERAPRDLAQEPLTADDWRKVWEALKAFRAAVRQIVFEARCRRLAVGRETLAPVPRGGETAD